MTAASPSRADGPATGPAVACLAVLLTLAASASPAHAQALPAAADLSCAAVTRIVQSSGAAVIRTGPHLYARYTAAPTLCDRQQTGLPVYARTRDAAACLIGYECRDLGCGQ